MAVAGKTFDNLKDDEDFKKWFWTKSNGNDLIKELNKVKHAYDKIRREKYSPCIYGLIVNYDFFKDGSDLKFMKVGFTHGETKTGSYNRMEQVQKEINRKLKARKYAEKDFASVIFVLPINFIDTTNYFDTEDRIREQWGLRVEKELTKRIGLPVPTEWVLTTQTSVNTFIKVKRDYEKDKKDGDYLSTDVFKGPTLKRDLEDEKSKLNKLTNITTDVRHMITAIANIEINSNDEAGATGTTGKGKESVAKKATPKKSPLNK